MKNELENMLKSVAVLFGNCVERMRKDIKPSLRISDLSIVTAKFDKSSSNPYNAFRLL
jgi:hypothetical protein